MLPNIDYTDLKILEGLNTYGPRNVTRVARKLGIPAETMRKRLKRLKTLDSEVLLRFNANVYHTNLGLKKAVALAEATPGYEDLLFKCLKTNDFWIAVSRCYGRFEGCLGIYTIPKAHTSEFKRFIDELENLGLARNIQIFWSTCFHSVPFTRNWFDEASNAWVFPWDKWVEEIPSKGTKLPYTLVDPEDFRILGDETDLFILKELEKDATISFTDLAETLSMSPQLVRYHFRRHLMERGLIESFEVTFFNFDKAVSDYFVFIFQFEDMKKLAKFALSLLDKPFAKGLGKILGDSALLGYLYLPKPEFRNFIASLSKLIRRGWLQAYDYVIQDLKKASRQTISYKNFSDGSWLYDHKRHIRDLREMVDKHSTGLSGEKF